MKGRLTVRYEIGGQVVEMSDPAAAPTFESIKMRGGRLLDIVSLHIDPVGMGAVTAGDGPVKENPPEFARYQRDPGDETGA